MSKYINSLEIIVNNVKQITFTSCGFNREMIDVSRISRQPNRDRNLPCVRAANRLNDPISCTDCAFNTKNRKKTLHTFNENKGSSK